MQLLNAEMNVLFFQLYICLDILLSITNASSISRHCGIYIVWLFFTENGSQRQLSYSLICCSINSAPGISKASSLIPKTYLSEKVEGTGRLVFSEKDGRYAHTSHFKYFLKVTGPVDCVCDEDEESHRTLNDILWKSSCLSVQWRTSCQPE